MPHTYFVTISLPNTFQIGMHCILQITSLSLSKTSLKWPTNCQIVSLASVSRGGSHAIYSLPTHQLEWSLKFFIFYNNFRLTEKREEYRPYPHQSGPSVLVADYIVSSQSLPSTLGLSRVHPINLFKCIMTSIPGRIYRSLTTLKTLYIPFVHPFLQSPLIGLRFPGYHLEGIAS